MIVEAGAQRPFTAEHAEHAENQMVCLGALSVLCGEKLLDLLQG